MIEANTFEGAVFGLGFLHAKDRLWQLDFYRRLAQGRLSEVLGPLTISVDKYMRIMGLPRAIEEHTRNLQQDDLDALVNYAAGVNKVKESIVVYPREFMVLWTGFEDWTPKDSVSVEQLIILFVSTDWFIELLRERLLEVYDKPLVDRLLPYKKEDYF